LGSAQTPYTGTVALDGNLTTTLLEDIATDDAFARADLRIAPASPGKAERLRAFLLAGRGTLYVNLEEAGLLCHHSFDDSAAAAAALLQLGAARALVTNGGQLASDATPDGIIQQMPPEVLVTRVTGAGDTFMAAHMAAEHRGNDRHEALSSALQVAADYVSGETPL
jgi:sugar/nucleoside kinase (ribokinase family)